MSSPNLPPEIMAALRKPVAESDNSAETSQSDDEDRQPIASDRMRESEGSDDDAALPYPGAVTYEDWQHEQTWSVRAPDWS